MVSARRSFEGRLPLADMKRLGEVLADATGDVGYTLDFARDELGTAYLDVHVRAPLTLLCQRTLEPFVLHVVSDQRLALVTDDRQYNALPPGCEPLLVTEDRIHPAAVVEDELLLAVPAVPVSPCSTWPEDGMEWGGPAAPADAGQDNPFAILGELKHK